MNAAIITSVAVNLIFKYLPELVYLFSQGSFYSGDLSIHNALAVKDIHNIPDLFWIWYNLTGFIIALFVAIIVSRLTKGIKPKQLELSYSIKLKDIFQKESVILLSFFVLILVVSYILPSILS